MYVGWGRGMAFMKFYDELSFSNITSFPFSVTCIPNFDVFSKIQFPGWKDSYLTESSCMKIQLKSMFLIFNLVFHMYLDFILLLLSCFYKDMWLKVGFNVTIRVITLI